MNFHLQFPYIGTVRSCGDFSHQILNWDEDIVIDLIETEVKQESIPVGCITEQGRAVNK